MWEFIKTGLAVVGTVVAVKKGYEYLVEKTDKDPVAYITNTVKEAIKK